MRRCAALLAVFLVSACSSAISPSPASLPSPALATLIPSPAPTLAAPSSGPTAAPIPTVSSVAFVDPLHGLVVGGTPGGQAAVWRTADGGMTWTEAALAMPALTTVAAVGSSAWATVMCANPAGLDDTCALIASSDGGESWHLASDRKLGGTSFVDPEHGWSVGVPEPPMSTGVLGTSDGGRSWAPVPGQPCQSIGWAAGVSFVSQRTGWLACAGPGSVGEASKAVDETTDGGRTWSVRTRVTPPGAGFPNGVGSISMSDYLEGISMRASGVGLAWEGRGGTLRTTNGGRTWTDMPPGGSDAGPVPQGGQALNDRDWFVLMWDGDAQATILYATHDAGRTWKAVSQVH